MRGVARITTGVLCAGSLMFAACGDDDDDVDDNVEDVLDTVADDVDDLEDDSTP